jgi:hypothetical protein
VSVSGVLWWLWSVRRHDLGLGRRNTQARTLRIVEEAWKSGDGTLRLIVFMGAATCAALTTLGGGAWLAGLL